MFCFNICVIKCLLNKTNFISLKMLITDIQPLSEKSSTGAREYNITFATEHDYRSHRFSAIAPAGAVEMPRSREVLQGEMSCVNFFNLERNALSFRWLLLLLSFCLIQVTNTSGVSVFVVGVHERTVNHIVMVQDKYKRYTPLATQCNNCIT